MALALGRLVPVAAFCASLAAGSVAVHLLSAPELPVLSPKVAWLAEHEEIDVVAIGTSHVLRSFVPDVFDAAVAERAGRRVCSFNAGVPALTLAEADQLVAGLPHHHGPRWILVDAALAERPAWGLEETRRAVAAATPTEGWLALRYLASGAASEQRNAWLAQLGTMSLYPFWTGVAAEAARRGWSDGLPGVAAADEGQGYAVEARGYQAAPTARRAGAQAPTKDPRVGGEGDRTSHGGTSPYREALYARILEGVTAAGATPVLLRTPNLPRPPVPRSWAGVATVDMAEPTLHPELYGADFQDTDGHMNDAGARIASQSAAIDFTDRVLRAVH